MKKIVLAGGCFWGVEGYFKLIPGVKDTQVGYTGGHTENPTYEQVCSHATGHAEACLITYDEQVLSLETLLKAYWEIIDPTMMNQQGHDIGPQYRTGIYYIDDTDVPIIIASKTEEQEKYEKSIVTEIEPLERFWDAEGYHQDYLDKNPGGYCHIDLSKYR